MIYFQKLFSLDFDYKNIWIYSSIKCRVMNQITLFVSFYFSISSMWFSFAWTDHKSLKYFTVLTRSSKVASSSQMKRVDGWCWKAETVHMWLTPSSIAWKVIIHHSKLSSITIKTMNIKINKLLLSYILKTMHTL